jgi:predicted Zn-dependent peptidase
MAAWLGGQEALHDRVLTLDDALAALDRVTSADVRSLAERLIRDEGLALAVVAPPGHARHLDRALRLT